MGQGSGYRERREPREGRLGIQGRVEVAHRGRRLPSVGYRLLLAVRQASFWKPRLTWAAGTGRHAGLMYPSTETPLSVRWVGRDLSCRTESTPSSSRTSTEATAATH